MTLIKKNIRPCLIFFLLLAAPHFAIMSGPAAVEPAKKIKIVWKVQESGCQASLRGVSAVSDKVAWASGSAGTFLRTVDGGEHWQPGKVPGTENLDFRDIQAFDANHALVLSAGRPAKIFRTSDGGKTWTEAYSNDTEGIFFDAFAFWDEKKGIAVGDPQQDRFMLIITSDGGKTWAEIPPEKRPQANAGEGAFAASGTCLTVGGRNRAWFCTGGPLSRVFFSADRGRSWEAFASPLAGNSSSAGGFSIAFADRRNGVLVGGDYKNETAVDRNAAVTSDGGMTWIIIDKNQPAGFRECALFVPGTGSRIIMTVGPSGSDFSLDGGRSWTAIAATPPGLHSLSFVKNKPIGWAVGKNGLIAKLLNKM